MGDRHGRSVNVRRKGGGAAVPPPQRTAGDGPHRGAVTGQGAHTGNGIRTQTLALETHSEPPLDTFSRVRANCTGAPYMDLDKHAANITEVVALAKSRHKQFIGRDGVQAP